MRKLIALALALALLPGCTKTERRLAVRRAANDIVASDTILTQELLEDAWREALIVGKGNPTWPLPMTLARVVYVPSTLNIGPFQFYGITVTEPMLINGQLEMVETIEIHLPHKLACHMRQVLVHELLHVVFTRRYLTDKSFESEVQAAGGGEELVRRLYPVEDMGLCGG